ncbi:MAG: DEAD/DEAH box helicase [Candidatus Aenigmarchaeota archaeon]|nr:DEAD/DEAH box helicase [Candidatus Aenigmarchaeota archaeon]
MVFELFSEKMQSLIKERGFIEPTLPQILGIPEIMKGKNVLIVAPTGIGKTEACMLPLLDKVYINKEKPIAILYITPLRALNRDLLSRLFWWADKLGLEIYVRHGDTSKKEREEQREMPSHILITTPETLGAILPGKRMREHLKNVKYVVIDEIHELVENKRGSQLSILLERLSLIANNFQRIALSATIGSVKKVAEFLGKDVKIINAEQTKLYEISVELPKKENLSEVEARIERIKELVSKHKNTIIFTNTRETAEILGSRFKLFEKELPIEIHHGSLSKNLRIKVEQAFKSSKLKAIVATSSLELGIDIGSIDLVIQYLSPRKVTKLLQRVGRSGHRVGGISKGIIITSDEDAFESCVIAKKSEEKSIENIKIPENNLDILATQIVGIILDRKEISIEECYKIIKKAYPYRRLKFDDFLSVIEFLEKMKLVYISDDYKKIKRRKRGWEYYYENLSSIPDVKKLAVFDIATNEIIGFLDESFVVEYGDVGNTFICAGSAWRIIQVENNKVLVEYVEDAESAIPAWEGELIPVPFEIAQEVGKLRRIIYASLEDEKSIIDFLKKDYKTDENAAREMIRIIKEQSKYFIPDEKNIFIESSDEFIVIHSCFGNLVNQTLGKYIATVLTLERGEAVEVKIDPYRIIMKTFASADDVKRIIANAKDLEETIRIGLEKSSLFKWNFFQIAKRFGTIGREATIDEAKINRLISVFSDSPIYKEAIRTIFFEKMDIERTKNILQEIKNGNIKIKIIKGKFSPLAQRGIEIHFFDIVKPKRPYKEIYEAFKRRLMQTRIRIICTNCWNYSITTEVKELDDSPTCPKCNSKLIGIWDYKEKDPKEILKKKSLTKEEKKILEKLKRSASLMITYGKRYALAHAARGVGVETAARILAKMPKSEEELLKYIFEAEKSFASTRKYWKI